MRKSRLARWQAKQHWVTFLWFAVERKSCWKLCRDKVLWECCSKICQRHAWHECGQQQDVASPPKPGIKISQNHQAHEEFWRIINLPILYARYPRYPLAQATSAALEGHPWATPPRQAWGSAKLAISVTSVAKKGTGILQRHAAMQLRERKPSRKVHREKTQLSL